MLDHRKFLRRGGLNEAIIYSTYIIEQQCILHNLIVSAWRCLWFRKKYAITKTTATTILIQSSFSVIDFGQLFSKEQIK